MKIVYEDKLHEFKELNDLYASNQDVTLFIDTCNDSHVQYAYDSLMIKCGKIRWLGLHEFEQLLLDDNPYPEDLRLAEEPDIKINSLRFSLLQKTGKYNYSIWNDIETGLWNVAIIHIQPQQKPERQEYLVSPKEVCACIRKAGQGCVYIPLETEPEEVLVEEIDVKEDLKDIISEEDEETDSYIDESVSELISDDEEN